MSASGNYPDFGPNFNGQYGTENTYRIAAEWLDGHGDVWDWGCGRKYAQRFFANSAYFGIDGADGLTKLEACIGQCDSILMRHVLEHNPGCWQTILGNALASFRRRMALVTFTEFAETTHVYKIEHIDGIDLPYLRFRKADLTDLIGDLLVSELAVQTTHPEHVFFLERK